jgi:hypothetical protein
MSSALPQFMCKVCGKLLPAHAVASARKGHAVRCVCGAPVRVAAVPATRAPATAAAYDVADDDQHEPAAGAGGATKASARSQPKPLVVPGLEEDAYRCPSCNAAMAPGTVVCSCGFNLNTGQHLPLPGRARAKNDAKPSASARRAGSAFGIPAPHRAAQVTEDRAGQLNQILIAVALMLLLLAGIMAGRLAWRHFNKPVNYVGDDAKVAELIDDSGGTEIHAWLKQDPQRIAGGMSSVQALALADRLQLMGAKQVLAFGSRMTRVLAIELPENPDQRKALFVYENDYEQQHFEKPSKDVGQHYLLMNLGL